MSAPTLSLLVPAYNAAEYLPRLLESAQDQTTSFDEVLVYDDCSTDDTADVAKEYGAHVISGEVNKGPAVGRQRLAETTTSDWLHFHDADDILLPNFVERARRWMTRENPPEVVLFNYEYRREDDGKLLSTRHFNADELRRDPIDYTIREQINPFCGIYHRESFLEAGGMDTDPKVLVSEDLAMHYNLAQAGLRFDADSTVTVVNYMREGSYSRANPVQAIRARYHVLEKCARRSGDTHGETIARELWQNAGSLAAHLQWDLADKATDLAIELNGRIPNHGNLLFQAVGGIHPRLALRMREWKIRLLEPQLRDTPAHGTLQFPLIGAASEGDGK